MNKNSTLRFEDLAYTSSFDETSPLRVLVAYRAEDGRKPLMVCMHSYGGDRRQMVPCLSQHAEKGFFAVAPDMRGRADSAGHRDDGGLEVADIHDAVQHVLRTYADQIDPDNLNIAGWSGGGGSAYMATVKMPELFRSAQAFYGISDYEYLARSSENWMRQVSQSVGQTPVEAPHRYLARNAIHAVGNNRCTHFQIFWDDEETLCPKEMNLMYLKKAEELGLSNIVGRPSAAGDQGRWFHGKEIHPEIARAMYEPQIRSGAFPAARLPNHGTLIVPGFLITSHFTVCLGTGENALARVDYRWDEDEVSFKLHDPKADNGAKAWARFPLQEQKTLHQAWVNDERHMGIIRRVEDPDHIYLYNLGLDDAVRLEWR